MAKILVIDDDVIQLRAEPEEDAADEIVGKRPVLLHAAQRHLNGVPDRMVDVDNERFLLVAEKNGAPVGGGHDTFNRNGDNVVLHCGDTVEPSVAACKRGAHEMKAESA